MYFGDFDKVAYGVVEIMTLTLVDFRLTLALVSLFQPDEDISDDYLFPMTSRIAYGGGRDSDLDISRPLDDLDTLSPIQKKHRLVRSSSDPSVNTTDKIPGIPPYPDPPRYQRSPKVSKLIADCYINCAN